MYLVMVQLAGLKAGNVFLQHFPLQLIAAVLGRQLQVVTHLQHNTD